MVIRINNLIILLATLFLVSCSKQHKESGVIKADLGELTKDFDQVVIKRWGFEFMGDSLKISDTIPAANGQFEYRFKVKQPKYTNITLLKNKKVVSVISFKDKFSKEQTCWGDLYVGNEDVLLKVNDSYEVKKIKGICYYKVDFFGSEEAEMFSRITNGYTVSEDNIKSDPGSFALFEKLFWLRGDYSEDQLKRYASLFSEEVKNSISYQMLQDYITTKESLKKNGYQKKFNWVDVNGRSYNFQEVQNGKLLILVFWASWCGPCRKEIPNLKKFYEQYNDKVSIVSLSIDDNYNAWKTAVEKEQMPWLNLSGLPKSTNGVKKEYNISEVPNMILFDRNGKTLLNVYNDLPKLIKAVDSIQ